MKKFTMHPMNPIKWFFFYVGIFAIGWESALYIHTCTPEQPFSRSALKSHLKIHGDVSDGRYITSEDSKLWTLCTSVCDMDTQKYMESMGFGDVK